MADYPSLGDWNGTKPGELEESAGEIAERLAWSALDTLTAGRVAFQITTLRPMVIQDDGTIILPGPVGGIDEIRVDGAVVTDWRLDDSVVLQRTGTGTWQANTDLTQASNEVGVTEIDYYRGFRPGRLLIWAAGQLANEFYLAASNNKKCRLPRNVTAITRQGVSFEMSAPIFSNGKTGIHEIDVILARYNPYGVSSRPVVATPESIAASRRIN